MTKRSASAEAISDARPASWSDAGVETASPVERLSPEQPEHGLLWVTRGSLTLTRAGRVHEVRKGTVVAYRLGGGLTWSAAEGTHVRWCSREVGVGPGQVAPWTSELSLDGPIPAAPRRRPLYVAALVAAAWILAIGVAWVYGRAHSQRVRESSDIGSFLRSDADTVRSIFLAHGLAIDFNAASGGRRLIVVTDLPPLAELPARLVAARDAADDAYKTCVRVQNISIAFTSSENLPEIPGRYFALPPAGGVLDVRPPPAAATLWKKSAAAPRTGDSVGTEAADGRRQR